MKCSNCGAELADGAKFCGECGTKVVVQNTCPECGTVCPADAKFCAECGHKFGGGSKPENVKSEPIRDPEDEESEEPVMMTAKEFFGVEEAMDWDSPFESSDAKVPLTEDQTESVRMQLEIIRARANDGRVLLAGDSAFDKKLAAFKRVFGERIGVDVDETPFFANDMLIGMVVNGEKGTGERGTLFTKLGIFIVDKDFPWNDGKGEPVGVIVPWKLFYIFGERIDSDLGKTCYRLVKPGVVLKSDKVTDEVKSAFRDDMKREHGDKGMLFRFGDTGLDADDVQEFMNAVKQELVGDDECDEMLDEEEEE